MKDYERLTEKGKPKYCEKLKSGIANWEAILRLSNLEDKIESGEIDYVADKDKEIARLTEENARLKKEKICLNIAEDNGVFVCSECKFATLNDYRLKLNKQICGLLRLNGDNVSLYAAQRIKELEAENELLIAENAKIDEYKCVIADISEQCEELEAENAELHARLEKAVILPCKVGDTVYWIEKWRTEPQIDEYTVHGFMIDTTNEKVCIRVKLDKDGFFVPLVGEYKDKQLFFDRAKAEARLAELRGGDQE